MVDIPGDPTTTQTVTVGTTTSDTIEFTGDRDWFRINLTAGQSITVTITGLTLSDPLLMIRDQSGNLLFRNDDSGDTLNSTVSFQAQYTGTYYIDVGAWEDPDNPGGSYPGSTGTYRLDVVASNYTPAWTNDQIADQLSSGYWGGDDHHFNVTQGGTITVNISGLTSAETTLARTALAAWADIIGVQFQEVTSGGQIVFYNEEESGEPTAYADSVWTNGIISSSEVHISTSWVNQYGSALGTYGYQTYLHEIGHALGLGHAGNYNNVATYPYDALYVNDSWATSVMSYFTQTESDYFNSRGFSRLNVVTPMAADILAVQSLYGLSATTRSGDTTYGFNSNLPLTSIYNAQQNSLSGFAYTIFDTGGTDTIDFSGYLNVVQLIDLNPEAFSNVAGRTGNMTIARGTIIENAIGGTGRDTIFGNSANNVLSGITGNDTIGGGSGNDTLTGGSGVDVLTGGSGTDTFQDTRSGLNGDTITDFSAGDKIVFTDATLGAFTFTLSGSTLTYTGGSLTLTGLTGTLVASAAAGGAVQLMIQAVNDARNDFNGDGRSDILWRDNTGTMTTSLGQANGGFASNAANFWASVPTSWQVIGTGDFNGDGRDDILWRDNTGATTNWLGQSSGAFSGNDTNFYTNVPTGWQVQGIGDFNGDGRDDILWRNPSTGQTTDWLGQGNGSFAGNDANALSTIAASWQVTGTGDFNGDGRSDILWRDNMGTLTTSLGQANGGLASNAANFWTTIPTNWQVVGSGDFNGDGRDDILWRDNTGATTNWLGQVNGGFSGNDGNFYATVATSWQVEGIGDFNGDGRDDILWRNPSTGQTTDWLGQANGAFTGNDANAFSTIAASWQVQPPTDLWG